MNNFIFLFHSYFFFIFYWFSQYGRKIWRVFFPFRKGVKDGVDHELWKNKFTLECSCANFFWNLPKFTLKLSFEGYKSLRKTNFLFLFLLVRLKVGKKILLFFFFFFLYKEGRKLENGFLWFEELECKLIWMFTINYMFLWWRHKVFGSLFVSLLPSHGKNSLPHQQFQQRIS